MIGTLVIRTAHQAIAIGALDIELREGSTSRWRTKIVLLSDGMRIESAATLDEEEIPALGAQLDELVRGQRSAASLASADGSLYLAFEAHSESELVIVIRMLREGGVISVAESRITRAHAGELASAARRFPYG